MCHECEKLHHLADACLVFITGLIPLGAVTIFVQRQVNETILGVELQAIAREARFLAAETASHPGTFGEHTDVFRGEDEQAFLLTQNGI